jgi:hypothetical protein
VNAYEDGDGDGREDAAREQMYEAQEAARLRAEVERLTSERDDWQRRAARLADQVELSGEAPPIPCVEVDATDGRRTWRAMGDDVRTLGDGWEWHIRDDIDADRWYAGDATNEATVYLIRRTTPPAPRTERVQLADCIGRRLPGETWKIGLYHSRGSGRLVRIREREADNNWEDVTPDPDGTVEVLTEDGNR